MSHLFAPTVCAAMVVAGAAANAQYVVDGDTIKLDSVTCRLWGIDAPESKQLCDGAPIGGAATEALRDLIKGKVIECEKRATDRYPLKTPLDHPPRCT